MLERGMPPADEMFRALLARDAAYEGIFFVGVRTTGIFCRPACPARKPARRNVEFFRSAREALGSGYRPCKRCRPLEPLGTTPEYVRRALALVDEHPGRRVRDRELRESGLDPVKLRRWFGEHHGMTFQAYQRTRRLGKALLQLANGGEIPRAAFSSGYESLSAFQDALRKVTGRSPSGEEIGLETHAEHDQFIRVEAGTGYVLLNGEERGLEDGSAVVIPAGVQHNVVNTSRTDPLRLYTLYSPPEHPDGTVHHTKAEAEAGEH